MYLKIHNFSAETNVNIAGLEPNIDVNFGDKTLYGDTSNLTVLDKVWWSMDTNPGIVALPMDHHLGTTDPFPWDDSKGLYVLNSYHSLHCLVCSLSQHAMRCGLIETARYLWFCAQLPVGHEPNPNT
jgi:hypothetical protein